MIAHNSFVSKQEYLELIKTIEELKEVFEKAIQSVDKIIIPQSEKQALLENVETVKNHLLEEYYRGWTLISDEVKNLYEKKGFSVEEDKGLKKMVEKLVDEQILTQEFYLEISPLGETRNKITELEDDIIVIETKKLNSFYSASIFLEEPFI